jgi:putative ABC transport system ATP-binding protein
MIELRGVTKEYPGKKSVFALRDVDLDIAPGEMVSIMGPSGSGKCTLLNILGGLDQPTRGSVKIAGSDLTTLNDEALTRMRRERIGFVFQFFNLISTLTAFENIALPMYLAGKPRKDIRPKVSAMLSSVGLSNRETHLPEELSGGEQQRVAIARALAKDVDLILGDEPTGALDTATQKEIINLLKTLAHEYGKTIILVTHSDEVAGQSDIVLHLHDGKLFAS